MHALSTWVPRGGHEHSRAICITFIAPFVSINFVKISKTDNKLVPHTNNEYKVVIQGGAIIEGRKKSVETLL